MGFRPAPKGLPQTSHGYTVDFAQRGDADYNGTVECGDLFNLDAQEPQVVAGYWRVANDTSPSAFGLNPKLLYEQDNPAQFIEALCFQDSVGSVTNPFLGVAVFCGSDTNDASSDDTNGYLFLKYVSGGGSSSYRLYRRDGTTDILATVTGKPDVDGKHFLMRLEAVNDGTGVRLKCWVDGELIIEFYDTTATRLTGKTSSANIATTFPGLNVGFNGTNDSSRRVHWFRAGLLPELSESKPSIATFLASPPITDFFYVKTRKWTSRPPWGTPIDMSNPLAHKLKRFVLFDSGDLSYDFVQGKAGAPQTNYGSNSVTKYGRAQNMIQSTGTQSHTWPDEASVIKDFGTLGHTFMALARSDTAGTPSAKPNQEFIAAAETTGSDDLWNYRLLTDGSPRYTIYYDSGTIANSESPYPTGKDATDWCFHGGTWDADRNEIICRIDRAQDATPGSVPGTVGVGDSSTIFSVGSNDNSSSSWDGDIVFAAEWLRPLSDAEWDQMIDNPWQIFEPQRTLVGVAITAAGVVITDVANSGETPGSGSETWDDGSTGNVITGTGFL